MLRPYFASHRFRRFLERPPHARLQLARIAEAAANRAVKVEDQIAVGRIAEVVVAGQVEDLDQRLDLAPRADWERVREAHIPRKVGVVLAQGVARPHRPAAGAADPVRRTSGPLARGRSERISGPGTA